MGWNDENIKKIFGGKLPEVEYTVKKTLTAEDIDDIFTTAIEGGIGYWSVLDNTTPEWKKAMKNLKDAGADCYWGTVATKVLLNGDKIRFYDAEADEDDLQDDEIWYLDMEKFINGCEIYEKERGSILKCLIGGDFDAVEADCFIQYCLFGEIIFG